MLNLRRLRDNFVSAAAMRAGNALLSFMFFVVLARQWSEVRLGEFSTVLALFLLLYQAPLLGLHIPLIRDIAKRPERIGPLVVSGLTLGLTVALLLGVALSLVGILAYPPALHGAIWLVALSLVPCAVVVLAEAVLVAQERLTAVATANMIESVVRTLAWLALVRLGFGLTSLFACLVVTRALMGAAYLRWMHVERHVHARDLSGAQIKELVRWCPTFLGIAVLAAAITRLDFVVLSQLGSLRDVGLYSPPYRLYEVALMAPSMLALVVFPAFSRLFEQSAAAFEQAVRGTIRLCVTIGLPCAITLAFLSEPVVRVLFGETYSAAHPVLQWLIFAPILAAVDQSMAMALLASGRQDLDLRVLATAAGFYLLALVLLVPWFGYRGAAIATFLTASVQVAARYRLVRRHLAIGSLTGAFARPAAAGAVMALTTAALWPLAAGFALVGGLAGYVASLLLGRAVTPRELRTLWEGLAEAGSARS
jgi:O-antigen/teichoic acid export membrane protein